jgi:hypothetical protein
LLKNHQIGEADGTTRSNVISTDQKKPGDLVKPEKQINPKRLQVFMLKNMVTASVKGRVGDDITQSPDDDGNVRNCSTLHIHFLLE